MAVNKVVINRNGGEETLIDLTMLTVTPEMLAKGVTARNAKGELIVGTAEVITEAVLGEGKIGLVII